MVKIAEALRLAASIKKAGPRKFTAHVVPHVVRPAQIIWNQALGSIFLLLALLFFGSALSYYRTLNTPSPNPVGLAFACFLGLTMSVFGVNAFRKARRLTRLPISRI